MERLTIIQETRLKCLQMSNDYYIEANKTMKYEPYSYEAIIYRAEQYLEYILEGTPPKMINGMKNIDLPSEAFSKPTK